jgi:hypothetical protein
MARLFIASLAVLAACADRLPSAEGVTSTTPSSTLPADTLATVPTDSDDALALLAFLNDPTTTRDVLDHDVNLDARAAVNLITHRDGPDAVFPSLDDDVFETLGEVDGVEWVGEATLTKLLAWVDLGRPDTLGGIFDDVMFTEAEAEATLSWVNAATLTFLDDDFGLDVRAARAIVDAQPLATVADLAAAPYVGATALAELRDAAMAPPSFGSTAESLMSDERWFVSPSDRFATSVTLHWRESAQLVGGAQALGLPVDDASELFELIDDAIERVQVEGSPSPYIYDWYRFEHHGQELGVMVETGSIQPVAIVADGVFVYSW